MTDEIRNKRMAKEEYEDNEEKNLTSKTFKVAVISGSSNETNFQDNSVVLRQDQSKVIIKIQQSPVKKSLIQGNFESIDDENNEELENDDSKKENVSQNIFDSILVIISIKKMKNLIFNYIFLRTSPQNYKDL